MYADRSSAISVACLGFGVALVACVPPLPQVAVDAGLGAEAVLDAAEEPVDLVPPKSDQDESLPELEQSTDILVDGDPNPETDQWATVADQADSKEFDLPAEPQPPLVMLSDASLAAVPLGALPSKTCAEAPPLEPTYPFPQGWPQCFDKPWPAGYGQEKTGFAGNIYYPNIDRVIALPDQRLLLIAAEAWYSEVHWLQIVTSNLMPVCQLGLPLVVLDGNKGYQKGKVAAKDVAIVFVRVATDRLFVGYQAKPDWDNVVIAEYGLDCKLQFLRMGKHAGACGSCPGYAEPGVAFAETTVSGKMHVTAYSRIGAALWKAAVPNGLPGTLTTIGSAVAVQVEGGEYVVLDQNGKASQVLPKPQAGADDSSKIGWNYLSEHLAFGPNGSLAQGMVHHDSCGNKNWEWRVEDCDNGLSVCGSNSSYVIDNLVSYFRGDDAFGWRIDKVRGTYNPTKHSVASISGHGRRTRWVDTAYGGSNPNGAYFFKDGGYLAWNEYGLIRANRLGSTTCNGCGPPAPDCSDNDACTKDSCDPALGDCIHEPISGCTKPKGACFTADDCDDGEPCTVDKCDGPSGACSHAANPVKNCLTGVWKTNSVLDAPAPQTVGGWYPSGGWVSPAKSVRPQVHEAPDGGLIVVDEWEVRRHMQTGKERYVRALMEPAGASALAPDGGIVLYVRQPEGKEVAGKSRFLRLKPSGQIAQDVNIESGLSDWILPDAWMERKRWLLSKPGGGGYQLVGRKTWVGDTWQARVVHLSSALTATTSVDIALSGIAGGDVPQTRGIDAVWAAKDGNLLVGWRKQVQDGREFGAAAFNPAGKLLWSKGLLDDQVAINGGFDPWRPHAIASGGDQSSVKLVLIGVAGVTVGKAALTSADGGPFYLGQGVKGHLAFGALSEGLAFLSTFGEVQGGDWKNKWKATLPPTQGWAKYVKATKESLFAFQELCNNMPPECSDGCGGGCYGGKCCTNNISAFQCNEAVATVLAFDGHAINDVHVLTTGWTALVVGAPAGGSVYSAVLMLDKDYRFEPPEFFWPTWLLSKNNGSFMYGCNPTTGNTWEVCCAQ